MSVDTAFARLRDANPVPEPARLRDQSQGFGALLTATRQRSMEMQTELRPVGPEEKMPTSSWRKAIPALAAAAVVIVVVAAAVWLSRDSETEVVDTPSPQGIAELFIEGDTAMAAELLAPDAVVDYGLGVSSAAQVPAWREYERVTGVFRTVTGCTETPAAIGVQVSCTYVQGNAWSEALGVGPFTGNTFDFAIVNGHIVELHHVFNMSEFSPQAWEPFVGWLRANHSENIFLIIERLRPMTSDEDKGDQTATRAELLDGSQGYLSGSRVDLAIVTPQAIALWEQFTNEFVASTTGSGS